MSEYLSIKNKTEKRSSSESNLYIEKITTSIKYIKKQIKILEKITDKKIRTNLVCVSSNIFGLFPRRCLSQLNFRTFTELDDEKIKFDDWIKYNMESHEKIEEEILQLLINIFDKRYIIYPNNMCGLSPFASKCKKNISIVCPNFNELSLYILYVLYQQFTPFFKYIDDKIKFKNIKREKYENIKEILYYIGKDIKKIFAQAIDNIGDFNFSTILLVSLEEYLIKNNIIEEKKIKNISLNKQKEEFENVLNTIQNYYFEKDYDKYFIQKTNLSNKDEAKNNKENTINDKSIEKKIINKSNENEQNHNEEAKNYNIDDLVNYINEPKTKDNKKKKKKKKKGKKVENNQNTQNSPTDNFIEEDLVFLNFKKSVEEFSRNSLCGQKIKPIYSEQFLRKLQDNLEC